MAWLSGQNSVVAFVRIQWNWNLVFLLDPKVAKQWFHHDVPSTSFKATLYLIVVFTGEKLFAFNLKQTVLKAILKNFFLHIDAPDYDKYQIYVIILIKNHFCMSFETVWLHCSFVVCPFSFFAHISCGFAIFLVKVLGMNSGLILTGNFSGFTSVV